MRLHRFAPFASLALLVAGCSVDSTDVDNAVSAKNDQASNKGDSIFVGNDEQTLKMAGDLGLERVHANRPELTLGTGELWVKRSIVDDRGEAHTRLGQSINGVPVFGAEAIVHMDGKGEITSITDEFVRDLQVDTTAEISEADALKIAYSAIDGVATRKIGTDLQILMDPELGGRLTHRVQLEATTNEGAPSMPVLFVDAKTGEILSSYDNLQTAKNRITYNTNNSTSLPGTQVLTETTGTSNDAILNMAHNNAGIVHDYYFSQLGRDSFDAAGATIKSTVHYSSNYVNAFWNGSQMVYGDGDGVQSSALTVLDVVGHEITHAVTERSSALVYKDESGALNEAMSDIFGATIEAVQAGGVSGNTWKIGEECWTPATAGDALRQMDDPALYGDFDYYPTRYTGTQDNGGVHWNSGIANLAFALAVKGGTHPRGKTSNVVPAINANLFTGIQNAAKIFYRANTVYMTASATYAHARGATEQAATDLFGAGSSELASITAAWLAVGVTSVIAPPKQLTWTLIKTEAPFSLALKKSKTFTYTLPAGATGMKFTTGGGSGDVDLYVRRGSAPTNTVYDCMSAGATNTETCTINPAATGTYYVKVYAYAASSGVVVTASSGQ